MGWVWADLGLVWLGWVGLGWVGCFREIGCTGVERVTRTLGSGVLRDGRSNHFISIDISSQIKSSLVRS